TMVVNTALGFVLLGICLMAIARQPPRGTGLVVGTAVAALLIGVATLWEWLAGVDLGIDQAFVADAVGLARGLPPGRMSIGTATEFVLLGGSALFMASGRSWPAQVLALTALALAAVPVLGFSYLSRDAHSTQLYETMALHTSIGFLLIAAALGLFQARTPISEVLLADTAGGHLLRSLGLPLVAGGWLIGLCSVLLFGLGV